ncbi:MAG: hypothetical protein HOF99_03085 [Rhodospirillaceae bacterium]|nr:hypothetical protein [Rhodospirillaceae bacterium]MBT3808463.1 hypothetical protein [Rhodospirillaceae bacterium]MBT3932148.1 hypothetical protein [Rhodospirillaceae bacterium]
MGDDNCAIALNFRNVKHAMTAQDINSTNINTGPERPIPLLDRLPQAIRASLTPEQQQALSAFIEPAPANAHPVDLRLTVPVPGRPVFLSVLAGPERRSKSRRHLERRRHPLHTIGNIIFLGSSLVGLYVLGLIAFLAAGSILQF